MRVLEETCPVAVRESVLASQVMKKLDDRISEIRRGLDRPAKIKGSLALLGRPAGGVIAEI